MENTKVLDLSTMLTELGTDGVADKLTSMINDAQEAGYKEGLQVGKNQGFNQGKLVSKFKERFGYALLFGGMASVVGCLIFWVFSCSTGAERLNADTLKACSKAEYAACSAGYQEIAKTDMDKAAMLARVYQKAAGAPLVPVEPPKPPDPDLQLSEKGPKKYVIRTNDSVITVEKQGSPQE